jgi:hypothetical protein
MVFANIEISMWAQSQKATGSLVQGNLLNLLPD